MIPLANGDAYLIQSEWIKATSASRNRITLKWTELYEHEIPDVCLDDAYCPLWLRSRAKDFTRIDREFRQEMTRNMNNERVRAYRARKREEQEAMESEQ
jgi:hypothetical protein